MSDKSYNGWTNYETWAVALWLGNDSASDQTARELAESISNDGHRAEAFKEMIEAGNPLADQSSLYSDLLTAAMAEVNWLEVANSFRGE